jgi:hypothetical protein
VSQMDAGRYKNTLLGVKEGKSTFVRWMTKATLLLPVPKEVVPVALIPSAKGRRSLTPQIMPEPWKTTIVEGPQIHSRYCRKGISGA